MTTLLPLLLAVGLASAPADRWTPNRSALAGPAECHRLGELEVSVAEVRRVDRYRAPPHDLEPLWAAAPCDWDHDCISVTVETRSKDAGASAEVGDLRMLTADGEIFRPLSGSFPQRLLPGRRYTFVFPVGFWTASNFTVLGEAAFATSLPARKGDFDHRGLLGSEGLPSTR